MNRALTFGATPWPDRGFSMEASFYDTLHRVQREHWWYAARRTILREVFCDLRDAGLPPGAIYDLACGVGANLPVLEEFHSSIGPAVGVEKEEKAVAYCRAQGHDVRAGELLSIGSLPPGSGALVLLADVIEHLDDDAGCLAVAHRLLAPGGALVVTVPAFPFLWGPLDDFAHHKRRYTAATLRRVVAPHFRIEKLSYFNTLLFGMAAVGRMVERRMGAVGDEEARVPPGPINALLRATFSFERHLLRRVRLPFGVSLLCIARSVPA